MRWLLGFVPISIVLAFLHASPAVLFIVSGLAIVPLAGLMGEATEDLARRWGQSIGGFLNATFGNATELILAVVALQRGEVGVVKASLIGSIIGNVLLVLGLAALVGGLKYKILRFNADAAQAHAVMMALAASALLAPALLVRSMSGGSATVSDPHVLTLSLCVASVLFVFYLGSLFFSLYTHEILFRDPQECAEPALWSQPMALGALVGAAIAVAFESELLVGALNPVAQQWHLNKLFLGLILVPILGNAAEHSTAVWMALRDKMDVSLSIVVNSSTQIALFVTPFAIFAGLFLGHPITILFSNAELVALGFSSLIAVLVSLDGKTHWLEGAQLLTLYLVIALSFFFMG